MLAGMMVMVSPGVSTRQQAARGATQLQAALAYSRNRAKMNMLPTGIQVVRGHDRAVHPIGRRLRAGLASGNGTQIDAVGCTAAPADRQPGRLV